MHIADEQNLDLVEIAPTATPPVCRVVDYQKFLYAQKKKQKEAKANQKKQEVKEIRFGPQTDDHDYNFKLKHAQTFLKDRVAVVLSKKTRIVLTIKSAVSHKYALSAIM